MSSRNMGVLSVSWKERDGVLKGVQHKDTYEDVGRVSQYGILKLLGSSPEQQGKGRPLPESRKN